ncbi:hypothetical protein KFK09_020310 [Dendrobium nobile]|uniref:Secreted protein n=1 Tax=Dendrobium nobile TaxID=94219 RepID=A0A8T3ATG9_DENNO|nr:hypothetical protein KFK09_020310 [Dendrobium nobile]
MKFSLAVFSPFFLSLKLTNCMLLTQLDLVHSFQFYRYFINQFQVHLTHNSSSNLVFYTQIRDFKKEKTIQLTSQTGILKWNQK